jgi:hypothetical protein
MKIPTLFVCGCIKLVGAYGDQKGSKALRFALHRMLQARKAGRAAMLEGQQVFGADHALRQIRKAGQER